MFLSVTSVTASCKMLFFSWICVKVVGFNKKMLSRAFLFLRVPANQGCFSPHAMLFLSVAFVFELSSVTAVTAKKQYFQGIYTRAWQARARSRPGYRAAQHKRVRTLKFYCMNSFMQSRTIILGRKKNTLSLFREFFTLWSHIEVYTYRGWCEEEIGCQQENERWLWSCLLYNDLHYNGLTNDRR